MVLESQVFFRMVPVCQPRELLHTRGISVVLSWVIKVYLPLFSRKGGNVGRLETHVHIFFFVSISCIQSKGSRVIREGSTKAITQWGREGTASAARDEKLGRRRSLIYLEVGRATARLNSNG